MRSRRKPLPEAERGVGMTPRPCREGQGVGTSPRNTRTHKPCVEVIIGFPKSDETCAMAQWKCDNE